MTRLQQQRAKIKWDREWSELKAKGLVGSFSTMIDALPGVLSANAEAPGWHWCILLETGNRGHVTQVDTDVGKPGIDVEGKHFVRINAVEVWVDGKHFSVPIFEEKHLVG